MPGNPANPTWNRKTNKNQEPPRPSSDRGHEHFYRKILTQPFLGPPQDEYDDKSAIATIVAENPGAALNPSSAEGWLS
jgi:hypothetical protein